MPMRYVVLMRFDPDDMRAYMQRDWGRLEALDRRRRATQPEDLKARIMVELYEAARATRPGWPSEADRRADLADHLALKALLDRAAHVGRR